MTDRNKWGLAIGLGLVWLLLLVGRVMNQEEPRRAPLKYTTGQVASAERQTGGVFGAITHSVQNKAGQIPFKVTKNIFLPLREQDRQKKQKLTVARKKLQEPSNRPMPPTVVAPPPPSPEEIARQQARQQLSQYRYVGYLTQAGESKAFLGKGREIYIVRTGDTVEGRVQVAAIEPTTVKLRDTPTNLETTIPLTKNGPS